MNQAKIEADSGASRLHDELERMPVVCRDFNYTVAVTSGKPSTEAMQLLAQVMDSYADLPDAEREGVVKWFAATYGNAR